LRGGANSSVSQFHSSGQNAPWEGSFATRWCTYVVDIVFCLLSKIIPRFVMWRASFCPARQSNRRRLFNFLPVVRLRPSRIEDEGLANTLKHSCQGPGTPLCLGRRPLSPQAKVLPRSRWQRTQNSKSPLKSARIDIKLQKWCRYIRLL